MLCCFYFRPSVKNSYLYWQVHELELQSPLLLRDNGRRRASFLRSSSEEALSLEDTFNGLNRQREQMQDPSLPYESAALQSNNNDTSGHPQSSCIYTASDMMEFSAAASVSPKLQIQDCRLDPPENFLPVSRTMAEISNRVRASTSSLPNRAKEVSSSGKPLAVSIDGSMFPDATLFDDFLEVESSLQALEADQGFQHSEEFCTPSNGDSLRFSQEYVSARGKPGSGLQQLKNMTTGKY